MSETLVSVKLDVEQCAKVAPLVKKVAKYKRWDNFAGVLINPKGYCVGAYGESAGMRFEQHIDDVTLADCMRVPVESFVDGLLTGSARDAVAVEMDMLHRWGLEWSDGDTRFDRVLLAGDGAASVLRAVASHASTDESRPVLTQMLIETETLLNGSVVCSATATDSYRLLHAPMNATALLSDTKVLVPAHMVKLFASKKTELRSVDKEAGDGCLVQLWLYDAKVGNYTVTALSAEGQFPNHRMLKPNSEHIGGTVLGTGMVESLKACVKLAKRNSPIRIDFAKGEWQGTDSEWSMPYAFNLPDAGFTMGVNAKFMLDAVKALKLIGIGECTIQTISALRPIVLEENATDGAYVILIPVGL